METTLGKDKRMNKYIHEIDEGEAYAGYQEAFDLIAGSVPLMPAEELSLEKAVGRIASENVVAALSYPSLDVSLKDGYAILSGDIAAASKTNRITLKVVGSSFAGGDKYSGTLQHGEAVNICSGAPMPAGAEAVISVEFTVEKDNNEVEVFADAAPGRNILRAGAEVQQGAVIVEKGRRFLPGCLGLAAASGLHRVNVYRRPRAAVLGVGDEVVAPGGNLNPGQLYASNLVTMESWLTSFGIDFQAAVVHDDYEAIQKALAAHIDTADAILTSGGAWGSERDLVIGALNGLGWNQLFHHVRIGPGKGIAYGLWKGKPVFCLPGGPASNEMAFIQLALPGLLRMTGDTRHPLPEVEAELLEDLPARHRAWTEYKDAILERREDGSYTVRMYRHRSRLQAIASASGLICIPEGSDGLKKGTLVPVQVFSPRLDEI